MSFRSRMSQLLDEPPPAIVAGYGSLRWVLDDSSPSRPGITIWYGKSKRPKRWRFLSFDHRQRWLDEEIKAEDGRERSKAARKEQLATALAEMVAKIDVGTILHYSWGYEQTNCDFFQVVEKRGRQTVVIREIGSRTVPGSEGGMCDYRKPAKDRFIGEPKTKRITAYGVSMSFGAATPCGEDESHYCSWYG